MAQDTSVASANWMVIGRQLLTPWGKFIDLLCIDGEGNLAVLELKRNKTEREIVAQLLDYGSYVCDIEPEEIPRIFTKYQKDYYPERPPQSIDDAFRQHFGVKQMPEELNGSHELVIVASSLDTATERIVGYLRDECNANINAIFFRVFKDGDREYLTRAWLREPRSDELGSTSIRGGEKIDWNGEYYVNFGDDSQRNWSDAIRYGFTSAGHGPKYRDAISRLEPGNRIWVNIPGTGFVGVGVVEQAAVPVDKFTVSDGAGGVIPILDAPHNAKAMGDQAESLDYCEYLVRVRWLKTVPIQEAVRERGFFGNQNCVAQPRDPKWVFTVDRLRQHFGISE